MASNASDVREWHDLGHGHRYAVMDNQDGQRLGIYEEHDSGRPDHCRSAIYFDGTDWADQLKRAGSSAVLWTVEANEPLTLSPSLVCQLCPEHGFIRQGQWVPA